jgi:hypothetical protein
MAKQTRTDTVKNTTPNEETLSMVERAERINEPFAPASKALKPVSTLTEEEATEIAVKMHDDGVDYDTITQHLKDQGYLSAKTRDPIKVISVRRIVREYRKGNQRGHAKAATFHVEPKADDFVNACKHLLDTPETLISNAMKQRMIISLLNMDRNNEQ